MAPLSALTNLTKHKITAAELCSQCPNACSRFFIWQAAESGNNDRLVVELMNWELTKELVPNRSVDKTSWRRLVVLQNGNTWFAHLWSWRLANATQVQPTNMQQEKKGSSQPFSPLSQKFFFAVKADVRRATIKS